MCELYKSGWKRRCKTHNAFFFWGFSPPFYWLSSIFALSFCISVVYIKWRVGKTFGIRNLQITGAECLGKQQVIEQASFFIWFKKLYEVCINWFVFLKIQNQKNIKSAIWRHRAAAVAVRPKTTQLPSNASVSKCDLRVALLSQYNYCRWCIFYGT